MQDLNCKTLTINNPENIGRRRFIISVLERYLRENNINVQNPNFQNFINGCVNLTDDDFHLTDDDFHADLRN
jgi:isopropylmalate/homocitrate/citramalate synthase